jgi:DNA mismatch repair protein MutL
MPVRRLDPLLIDRIAAGEVIERPAAAVKELVENALDAGAKRIEIAIAAGGRDLIRVADDGAGMDAADLALSVERHATSKLPDGDLSAIHTLGFRGEALPSIASVSRLEIRTRARDSREAFVLTVEDGARGEIAPSAHPAGTRIEARDLFAATPARLKFLKTDRAEAQACHDVALRLALCHPDVRFAFASDIGAGFDWPAGDEIERLRQALGQEFVDHALPVDETREGVRISGFVATPTFNKPNALTQFAYVNGRAVRDKLIAGALRGAYLDYLPRERHGAAVLSVTLDPHDVDVNVHPAKAEVRFRDASLVRGLIVGAVRRALEAALHRAAAPGATETLAALRAPGWTPSWTPPSQRPLRWDWRASPAAPLGLAEPQQPAFAGLNQPSAREAPTPPAAAEIDAPLGAARAQLHGNYILAQTRDGVVLVDQHAAHERIVYERLKRQREANGIERQMLLSPLVVDLDARAAEALVEAAEMLGRLGLVLEPFGPGAVLVRETPTLLAGADFTALVRDLAETLRAEDGAEALERRLDHKLATIACHYSVRSGRQMRAEEMNSLLREMEMTPGAFTCNHGRPTYVELKLADIEKLFARR